VSQGSPGSQQELNTYPEEKEQQAVASASSDHQCNREDVSKAIKLSPKTGKI
jgi:hypothetical protein